MARPDCDCGLLRQRCCCVDGADAFDVSAITICHYKYYSNNFASPCIRVDRLIASLSHVRL